MADGGAGRERCPTPCKNGGPELSLRSGGGNVRRICPRGTFNLTNRRDASHCPDYVTVCPPPPPSVSLFAITRFLCSSYILPEIPLSTSKQTKLVDPVFTLTRATNSSWNRINFVPCEVIRSREPIFAVCGPRGALCSLSVRASIGRSHFRHRT